MQRHLLILGTTSCKNDIMATLHFSFVIIVLSGDVELELGFYDELKEACIAAENLMKRALNESSRRQKADEEVVSAIQKV